MSSPNCTEIYLLEAAKSSLSGLFPSKSPGRNLLHSISSNPEEGDWLDLSTNTFLGIIGLFIDFCSYHILNSDI